MTLFLLFSILATTLNCIGWGFYLYGSYKKHIISSQVYLFFSFLMVINNLLSLHHFASFSLIMSYGVGVLASIFSLALSFKNPLIFTKKDVFLICFAISLFLALHFYPTTVLLLTNLYYIVNYFIYILKIQKKEVQEWYIPWFFWIFTSIFLFLGLLQSNPISWISPIINFICWGGIFILSYRQHLLKK